jgi:hypothetical protein
VIAGYHHHVALGNRTRPYDRMESAIGVTV